MAFLHKEKIYHRRRNSYLYNNWQIFFLTCGTVGTLHLATVMYIR